MTDQDSLSRDPDFDQNGLKVARTDEAIGHSLSVQRQTLLALKQNWDGYGAFPIPEGVIDVIFDEVTTEGYFVEMVPGSDGSMQAEWHMRGDVTVEYSVTPGGKRCLYVRYSPMPEGERSK